MAVLHPKFLTAENGVSKVVQLSMEEWEQVVEELEELADIRAYDEAKSGSQGAVPFEQAVREIIEGD